MISYLLDTNILSGLSEELLNKCTSLHSGKYAVTETFDELEGSTRRINLIKAVGIQELEITFGILQKVIDVVAVVGSNLELINLFKGSGTADVVMIAHILYENNRSDTLFKDEWVIVTEDNPLVKEAKRYSIRTMNKNEFITLISD